MYVILLEISALLAVMILPVLIVRKRFRKRAQKTTYKIDTNTEYARYAINEDGFLEEINAGKLSKH
jgi:hypothetical protein